MIEALYRLGEATVEQVRAALAQQATYSAIRAQLAILERKGYVFHKERHLRYVYVPAQARKDAGLAATRQVLDTFFDGSAANMLLALLHEMTPEELECVCCAFDKLNRR